MRPSRPAQVIASADASTGLPLRGVAALFLERQHLRRPRARALTPGRLVRFAEDVGGIQLDSINVIERAHHLTLWSRFGPYDREPLERLVYRRHVLFEYWAHARVPGAARDTSAVAAGDARLLRPAQRLGQLAPEEPQGRPAGGSARSANGPARQRRFRGRRAPRRERLVELEASAACARLPVDERRARWRSRGATFRSASISPNACCPRLRGVEPVVAEEFHRWHLGRSLHAMGAATETDLRMYLSFPRSAAVRRRALRRCSPRARSWSSRSRAIAVRWYALAADLPALARAEGRRAAAQGTALLSPFDSFLWHRARARRLLGFDYRIEVYTPGGDRVHGYYSLPIFHEGQLIGRLDPKLHRAARRLEVRSVHFEPWFANGDAPPAGGVRREPEEASPALPRRCSRWRRSSAPTRWRSAEWCRIACVPRWRAPFATLPDHRPGQGGANSSNRRRVGPVQRMIERSAGGRYGLSVL